MFRRLRAGIAVSITWGAAWAMSGVAIATWRVFAVRPQLLNSAAYWPRFALTGAAIFGLLGAAAGAVFAATLATRERDTGSVDHLSVRRSARWGAVAGATTALALPVFGITSLPALVLGGTLAATLGAASAVVTVTSARRRPLLS